jgi:hypothetical protein
MAWICPAEGTDWYKVEPNGTTTKVEPPVNECTNCTGEGAEMGAKRITQLRKVWLLRQSLMTLRFFKVLENRKI